MAVQPQPGSAAGPVRTLTVAVSYDDGTTWQPARLLPDHDHQMLAVLHHPPDAGFVSLRATAVDVAGNTVEQTIVRAYALKAR